MVSSAQLSRRQAEWFTCVQTYTDYRPTQLYRRTQEYALVGNCLRVIERGEKKKSNKLNLHGRPYDGYLHIPRFLKASVGRVRIYVADGQKNLRIRVGRRNKIDCVRNATQKQKTAVKFSRIQIFKGRARSHSIKKSAILSNSASAVSLKFDLPKTLLRYVAVSRTR